MKPIPRLFAVSAVAAAVACSDPFQPTTTNVSGQYGTLTYLTTDRFGNTTDWVAGGTSIALILTSAGNVDGQLFQPGTDTIPGFFVFMTCTWQLSGKTVHFSLDADTFVRDMPWVASENRLSADHTFGDGTRVRVVLEKGGFKIR